METVRSVGACGVVRDLTRSLAVWYVRLRLACRPVLVSGVLLLGATVVAPSGAAGAAAGSSDGPGGTVSVGASGAGEVPGSPATSVGGGGGGSASGTGSPWVCTDTPLTLNDESGPPGGPTPGGWFSVTCADLATGSIVTTTEWIAQSAATTPTPAVDPRLLAEAAERSIRLPRPTLHFDPSGSAIVNLPTWLWIDPSLWRPEAVSASAAGITATAVATPRWVSWSMGDGTTVLCEGPGTAYDPAQPPDGQSTTCAHTYLASSAGQPSPDGDPNDAAFPVTATVDWSVSWSAVGAPGGGVLPDLTTSSSASERVSQVESLNTLAGVDGTGAG